MSTLIVLIGTSAGVESKLRSELRASADGDVERVRGFGGFNAALTYLKEQLWPDLIHIDNQSRMGQNDLEAGCRKVAELVAHRVKHGAISPRIVIEDKDLETLDAIFERQKLPVILDTIPHALGFEVVDA